LSHNQRDHRVDRLPYAPVKSSGPPIMRRYDLSRRLAPGAPMVTRLEVTKTYKLFIGGAFPRSESGRSIPIAAADGRTRAHISHASRKALRDAVEAARKAQPGWANATAYNRGQVLYRMAEMLEGKRDEFAELLRAGAPTSAKKPKRSAGSRT